MPAHPFLRCIKRWRFRLLILLLQIPVVTLLAADKRLASGHVPGVVAHGNVTAQGRVAGAKELRLALGLPLRNTVELTNLLAAIYNPASSLYHHYLTPQEFAARFGPTPADYAAVIQFARTNGLVVTTMHQNRLAVGVTGRVADVERALHVKLNSYRHPTEARSFFAPDSEPTVDARLALLHVSGLDDFSRPHPNVVVRPSDPSHHVSPSGGSSPDGTYMGNDFRRAYVPGTVLTGAGQNVALLQFDDFHPEDITNYQNAIGMTNAPQVIVEPVDGGVAWPGAGSVEVALDIEMVLSMSPGVSNIYVYEAPNATPWLDILSQMADDNLASQLSCSWSGGVSDPASEQVFLQMAAQGQSFFVASGDTDAFTGVPQFPVASANVTEVGGTYLGTDTNGNYVAEAVWNRGGGLGSSGGIGLGVGMPVWQLGVDMTTNGGSTTYRNVPDVSLTAENIYIIADGQSGLAAGTSCAAPLWAGLTALINQQAAQLGQPPVGFLNPAIYAICRGTNYLANFHDITTGNNTSPNSPGSFYATPGFDLCTGWGTPAGTNLINTLTTVDYLGVLPPVTFSMSGPEGGPFPQTNWTVTLTNAGAASLAWSLSGAPAWLTVSAAGGTLAAHDFTNLSLALVAPNDLPAASYFAVLSVTNLALSRVQSVVVQANIGQSIVQNGGFETGDFTGWDLVGQTVVGPTIYNVVTIDANYPGVVNSGYFGAFLGQSGYEATLSQTLETIPGRQYLLSFWLANVHAGNGQWFDVNWNGTNLLSLVNPPAFAWTNFQFVAAAIDTNVLLQFAAENDPHYFGLDDVSVVLAPPVNFANCCVTTNGMEFTWPSLVGARYLVQYTTNLTDGIWQNLSPITAATNLTTYLDANFAEEQRFYRLVLAP